MNLFWDTRRLTQAREDHLTCFLAAALEVDTSFRAAYESRVLGPLAIDGVPPRIVSIRTQVSFAEQRCRPDMMLMLMDNRRVLCEHKIDAPETEQFSTAGDSALQLERYLELPGIHAVAYFRPSLLAPAAGVLSNVRYLHPEATPHFLWRDLYEPLALGNHVLSSWIRDGFERLGFTPPVPHVGELWPDESERVKQNQANFGKLWHKTRTHLHDSWKVSSGRRCELYLVPLRNAPVRSVYVSPLAQGGSLLRIRVEADDSAIERVSNTLKSVAPVLPVIPELTTGRLSSGRSFVDLLAPLHMILGVEADAAEHEERLFKQVVPAIDVLADA
jgi:hypothetical protein